MRGRWILGLSVSLLLIGCNKPPAEYHYRLMLPGPDAPDHADLLMGDKKIGTFYRGAANVDPRNERSRGFADVFIPASTTLAEHQGDLSVMIQGPSGTKRVAVKLAEGAPIFPGRSSTLVWSAEYEATRRKSIDKIRADAQLASLIDVGISLDLGEQPARAVSGPPVTIWIDRHLPAGTPIDKQQLFTVGALTVPRGERQWITDGLGTAYGTELPVAVDGKVVGTLKLDPKAKAYLISTEPACYRLETIQYASAKGPAPVGGAPLRLSGGKVAYSLWAPSIGYFLETAPSSGQAGTSTNQLSREPCGP